MTCELFTQIDIDSNRHVGANYVGLYYYIVCTLAPSSPKFVNTPQSDGEIMLFWKAKRHVCWSTACILFMVVSPCTH